MLLSNDAEAYSCRCPVRLGSFLDFLCFWGGGPPLGVVGKASTLGGGGGLGREPGVAGASRGSTGKRGPRRGSFMDICTYYSTDYPIVNGYVRIKRGLCVGVRDGAPTRTLVAGRSPPRVRFGQEALRQRQAIATRDMMMPSIDARVRSGIRPASKRLGNVQGEPEGVDYF